MPLWLLRGARVAVGRALASRLSLSLTPLPSPPVWLAVQPPPSSPHLSNHRAPHLLLVNSGKEREKKKRKNREMWSCRRAWGQPLRQATWSTAGARAGEEAQGTGAGATALPGPGQGPSGRGDLGEVERRAVKGRMNLQGLNRTATHHLVQLPLFIDVTIEAQNGKVTCPR